MQQVSPKYIVLGGCILAFGAAFVNVGFLLRTGASASHLTGDLSRLASELLRDDSGYRHGFSLVGAATLGFVLGAFFSGALLHHPELEIERPYGRVVSAIGILLVGSFFCEPISPVASIGLAGLGCGLQNAMASKYRGAVLRTTHMTGLVTDLGIMLGMRFRGHRIESWRIWVPFFLCLSFFGGSVCGAFAVLTFELPWLALAGGAYLLGGISWSLVKRRLARRSS
ncbi:YoaK family protein [Pelagicoccus sp. SDUM812005]|uniref:YoaK family protein n=1 Tax=Pelagicoccus sp. SDUM812005 TaxID=3041257 RepID=UPI002810926B|nr:YoaK family protein [Pelagicoccus sp. SDUM812005]MDQ8179459.1 YoaK family protein [Pelagicoccus sp. SDUM812005]